MASSHPQDPNFEDSDDTPANPSSTTDLNTLIQARYSRRDVLKTSLGVSALALLGQFSVGTIQAQGQARSRFGFNEIRHGVDAHHHVAPGYAADVLIRWGDPVLTDAPAFDPQGQSAATQLMQFGYNNDFVGYVPLPPGSNNSQHGLLCINHEYSIASLMLPSVTPGRALADLEMAAHGGSVIEIKKLKGKWQVVPGSPYARRINALNTGMRLSGPAAGHRRMQTRADPSGRQVIGTLANCAGGITPWGTYLMAEENFHGYFSGNRELHPEQEHLARYGIPGRYYDWGRHHPRFAIDAEPNEANRFGWIVEVDPLDPASVPVKRTALGRFKHEGAESIVNKDGRLVLYSGDDQRFEYLYRFVSRRPYDPKNRAANRHLLDHGTLSVARFTDSGELLWLPLEFGQGGLTQDNGFHGQADVLIETRRAADILGATPMDRPEDVEPNPINGRVYVMLTNNSSRGLTETDGANPRPANLWGHILELIPPDGEHAAAGFRWDMLLKAGNPANPLINARWNRATSEHGWFACPDNCAIDHRGRLWVATDQGTAWRLTSGSADGLWGVETEGTLRGTGKMFFRAPMGAELCGPRFTPDDRTLFVAVQHPGADNGTGLPGLGRRSDFANPAHRWPDFDPNLPPRPSVLAITREDGGIIGGT